MSQCSPSLIIQLFHGPLLNKSPQTFAQTLAEALRPPRAWIDSCPDRWPDSLRTGVPSEIVGLKKRLFPPFSFVKALVKACYEWSWLFITQHPKFIAASPVLNYSQLIMKAQHSIRNSISIPYDSAGMPSTWQSKRYIWPTQPTRSSLPCKSIPCDACATGRNLPLHTNSQWNHWLMGGWGVVVVLSKKWKQTSTWSYWFTCGSAKISRITGFKAPSETIE